MYGEEDPGNCEAPVPGWRSESRPAGHHTYVGGGLRYYLTRRFFLRAEYKAHWIFTRRNANEEADEWKLGFAFFY